tara:strand:- start:3360 stop:4343 length:984 start_codon:yes stop_codon:yes gene_type:complete
MAVVKNTANLLAEASGNLPDNTTQEISPQDIREITENVIISSYNKVTDDALVGLKNYDVSTTYQAGQGVIYSGEVYESNVVPTPGAFNPAQWTSLGGAGSNLGNADLTQTDQFRKYTLESSNPSYLEFQAGGGSDAIRLTDGLDLLMQASTSDPTTTYLTRMSSLGIQFGSGNFEIRHNGPSQFYIQGAGAYNGKIQLSTGVILQAPEANRAVELGGHFIKFKDRTLGVEHARFDQNGNFMFGVTSLFGSEKFSIIGETRIGGKLEINGTGTTNATNAIHVKNGAGTPLNLFIVRDNGEINTANLPTSSAGLVAGDWWNNSGVLNIV